MTTINLAESQNLPFSAYLVYIFYSLLSSLYICRESSTNPPLFMQNKPNFRKSQMNVNIYYTEIYENISDWTLGQNKPKQTQFPECQNEHNYLYNKAL